MPNNIDQILFLMIISTIATGFLTLIFGRNRRALRQASTTLNLVGYFLSAVALQYSTLGRSWIADLLILLIALSILEELIPRPASVVPTKAMSR
jgi:hypothetical protein